ncbi:MAG: hypothetical protein Q9157_001608 [Trypethelium eluteriae]
MHSSFGVIIRANFAITTVDEKQPICARCERHGLDCSGVRGTVFIDSSQSFARPRKKVVPTQRRRPAEPKGLPVLEADAEVPAALHLSAFRETFCISYTRKFLLRGGPVNLALNFVDFERQQNNEHSLLRDALLTLATTFFGHQHRHDKTKHQGYQLYGFTLTTLNRALCDPEQAKEDDVLLCVVTLGLLETFVPSGQFSWLMHIKGMERLLELRGPEAHRNPFSRQILQGIRRMLIFGSLNTYIPSILSRPEWKALEWKSDVIQKNTDEDLLNILADCPALFNRRDDLYALFENDQGAAALRLRTSILNEGKGLLEELKTWRQQWGEGLQDAMSERSDSPSELPSLASSSRDPPVPTWEFSGPAAATTMMLYFSIHIHILDLMSSVSVLPPAPLAVARQESLDPQVFPLDLGPTAPRRLDLIEEQRHYIQRLQTAALNVCRIVPYHLFMRSRLDAGSLHIGAMAIKLAWKAFQGEATVEGRWLKETILQSKNELPFAKGLWRDELDPKSSNQSNEEENER